MTSILIFVATVALTLLLFRWGRRVLKRERLANVASVVRAERSYDEMARSNSNLKFDLRDRSVQREIAALRQGV